MILNEYNEFKNNINIPNLSHWDYINYKGSMSLAVSFFYLFFPDTIELENCIFIKENFLKTSYEEWKKTLDKPEDIEKVINHIHIYDLFLNSDEEISDETCEFFGKILLKSWKFCLSERYPDRNIIFIINNESDGEYGTSISFYQKFLSK